VDDRPTIDFSRLLAQRRRKLQRIARGADEDRHVRRADTLTMRHVHHADWPLAQSGVLPVSDHADNLDVEHARRQPYVTAHWILVAEVVTREGFVVAVSLGAVVPLVLGPAPGSVDLGIMARLPMVLIPAYLVPGFIILHLTALAQSRGHQPRQ
jgi:hypothetical protein